MADKPKPKPPAQDAGAKFDRAVAQVMKDFNLTRREALKAMEAHGY